MKIKAELLKTYISDFINSRIEDFEIDADDIANIILPYGNIKIKR